MADDNKMKDIVGRVVVSPTACLSVGGNFRYGKAPAADPSATEEDERKRFGAEAEFKRDAILVQGEYIYGEDIGSYTTGGGCGEPLVVNEGSVKRHGFFIQGMYMTDWNVQPVLKYEFWDPNTDADAEKDREEVITFGINHFINEWTRVQVNYLLKREDVAVDNDEVLVQMQVKF